MSKLTVFTLEWRYFGILRGVLEAISAVVVQSINQLLQPVADSRRSNKPPTKSASHQSKSKERLQENGADLAGLSTGKHCFVHDYEDPGAELAS